MQRLIKYGWEKKKIGLGLIASRKTSCKWKLKVPRWSFFFFLSQRSSSNLILVVQQDLSWYVTYVCYYWCMLLHYCIRARPLFSTSSKAFGPHFCITLYILDHLCFQFSKIRILHSLHSCLNLVWLVYQNRNDQHQWRRRTKEKKHSKHKV